METSLLTTKLFVPAARPGLVARPRLMDRLQGAFSSSLVLVSAPAGFGKTTLLVEWIRQNQPPVATVWISLDEGDNDPVRFWDYFIAGLRTLRPGAGETASGMLHSPQPYPTASVLTSLINDVTSIADDFAVVLDDYHLIKADAIHAGVAFLLDHLPPETHLVVATREDPPWPLARFRGKGIMLEIDADDLRFTPEEASSLLKTILGQDLAAEDVQAINNRAEGWVVGLKMAALSLSKQENMRESITAFTGSQRYIMDYLMDEVLQQQPASRRDFLLKTSVLDRLSGPLCDALTLGTGGREELLDLEKANLFIIPLDETSEWYRYHHLFADLLRHRRDIELGKDLSGELHQKASQWYEDNGFLEDAVNHALAARDWQRAMRIIGRPELLARVTRTRTLLNWLQRIPGELLRTNLERYINYAWTLEGTGQYTAAEECVKYLDTVAAEGSHIKGTVANLRATIALDRGDVPHAEEYARTAMALSDPNATGERGVASVVLGATLMMQGRQEEAESVLRESVALFRRTGFTPSMVQSLIWLGTVLSGQGKLHDAVEAYREGIELAGDDPAAGMAHWGLGAVYYQWNDLTAAVKSFRQAVELLQLSRAWSLEVAYFGLARTLAASGDAAGAMAAMADADRLRSQRGFAADSQAGNTANHAAVALLLGDKVAAARWIDNLGEPDVLQLLAVSVAAVRLFWAKKDRKAVAERAETLREQYLRQGNRAGVACIRILQALDSLGPDSPLDCLAEALSICEAGNVIRVFVDMGMAMTPLLEQAVSRNIEPEFARALLTVIEAEERQRQTTRDKGMPVPGTSEFLSLRELEVLRLAAAGLSNSQIAGRLIVSVSTAKTHLHNVMQKLGTSSRTQAVNRARELRLI